MSDVRRPPMKAHPHGRRQSLLKGQASIMEYLLMSFFMLIVILVLIFFLGWWQFTQFHMENQKTEFQRVEVLMNRIINSPILVRENSVFDDSSLMAVQSLGSGACRELDRLFGRDWYIELEIIDPEPACARDCDAGNYQCCSSWMICPPQGEPESLNIRALPVNVYRKADGRTDLAVLRVGAYS